jgi:prephenate dehydrogenase
LTKTRITIVGCGFVGTVLGLALREAMPNIELIGHDKDQAAMKRAENAKAIDKGNWNLPASCDGASLVLVTIPSEGVELTLRSIGQELQPNAIIATIGGATRAALALGQKHVSQDVAFIATNLIFHPEFVSVGTKTEAAHAGMMKCAIWTLSPGPGTSPDLTDAFTGLVTSVNAVPVFMDALEHDGLSLSINVLPALLSSALMLAVSDDVAWRERQWLAGADFGDATSRADAAAEKIAQQVMSQREASVHWLNQAMLKLMAFRDAIDDGDTAQLQVHLQKAKDKRDQWLNDWHKGRDAERGERYKPPTLLGTFLGQNLAQRIQVGDKRK